GVAFPLRVAGSRQNAVRHCGERGPPADPPGVRRDRADPGRLPGKPRGIGANTAIFTLLNAVLLRPLPVQNPSELILFGDGGAQGSTGTIPNSSWKLFSYIFLNDFRQKET